MHVMLSFFGWDFLMITLPLSCCYFHLLHLLTQAMSFFLLAFTEEPLSHPWKQSPPSVWRRGPGNPNWIPPSCAIHFLLSCLLLSPLQAFPLPSRSAPSGPLCFHWEKGSRTSLAHSTHEGRLLCQGFPVFSVKSMKLLDCWGRQTLGKK